MLVVLFWGLKASPVALTSFTEAWGWVIAIFDQKNIKFFSNCIFLHFLVIKTLDPGWIRIRLQSGIQPKMRIRKTGDIHDLFNQWCIEAKSVLRIRIRDPVPFGPPHGSGMGKKSGSGSGINIPDPQHWARWCVDLWGGSLSRPGAGDRSCPPPAVQPPPAILTFFRIPEYIIYLMYRRRKLCTLYGAVAFLIVPYHNVHI